MKDVKVLGPGCKRCETAAQMVRDEAARLGWRCPSRRSPTMPRLPDSASPRHRASWSTARSSTPAACETGGSVAMAGSVMLEYRVEARRIDAHGSAASAKEATLAMDTDIAGRRDAFNPAELLLAAIAACMIKGIERVTPMIRFAFQGVEVKCTASGRTVRRSWSRSITRSSSRPTRATSGSNCCTRTCGNTARFPTRWRPRPGSRAPFGARLEHGNRSRSRPCAGQRDLSGFRHSFGSSQSGLASSRHKAAWPSSSANAIEEAAHPAMTPSAPRPLRACLQPVPGSALAFAARSSLFVDRRKTNDKGWPCCEDRLPLCPEQPTADRTMRIASPFWPRRWGIRRASRSSRPCCAGRLHRLRHCRGDRAGRLHHLGASAHPEGGRPDHRRDRPSACVLRAGAGRRCATDDAAGAHPVQLC